MLSLDCTWKLPSNHLFCGWVWGGLEEKSKLRLDLAKFQVKLPAGAELGNKAYTHKSTGCIYINSSDLFV